MNKPLKHRFIKFYAWAIKGWSFLVKKNEKKKMKHKTLSFSIEVEGKTLSCQLADMFISSLFSKL